MISGKLTSFLPAGKIGYGTVSEALAYKVPFVFVRRDYFNEEPFLRKVLEVCARHYSNPSICCVSRHRLYTRTFASWVLNHWIARNIILHWGFRFSIFFLSNVKGCITEECIYSKSAFSCLCDLEQSYRGGVEMTRRDFFSGRWGPYLQRAVSLRPCFTGDCNGGKVSLTATRVNPLPSQLDYPPCLIIYNCII